MTDSFEIPEALRALGNPLGVHPPRAGAGRTGYFIIAVVLAILAGLTVIGIVNPPAQNPPPAVFVSLLAVLGTLAIVFFGMGFFAPESTTLILFPEGLARTGGREPEIFRWSDIGEIYEFINPVAGKVRIVTRDGRKIEIDGGVKDGKKLGQALQQTLFDRMLPEAVKALAAGETLTFGALRLNQTSLFYKDKRVGWEEISKVSLLYNAYTRSVQFEVRAGSGFLPWCVVLSQNIPNLNVFKALVERKKAFTK